MPIKKYDLIVIGGGSGGLVCAAGGAGLGAKIALIEKKKLGGDCLNTGCVPSKALIRSAKIIHDLRHAKNYGINKCDFDFSFSEIMERVKNIQKQIEPHDSPERFQQMGVDVKFGTYYFKSPHEITNGEETLFGKKFVITTGSSPFIPRIPGLDEKKYLTSENVWELKDLPKRLLILGGGPIGSELAQCFARFGSKVILVNRAASILTREDPDMSQLIQKSFTEEGIKLHFNVNITKVIHLATHHEISLEAGDQYEEIECDALFIAVGRKPNIEGLELEKIGIDVSSKGIFINDYCQTSLRHIYACGDVAGPYLFTHFADYQARLILRNALFPVKARADYRVVPWCTYTDPELARVGLSEKEAKEKKIPVDVYKYDIAELDRAICDGEGRGLIKILTKKGSDRILGAAIVSHHAADVLQEIVLAMKQGLGLRAITKTIHPYPSMNEAVKRTADMWLRTRLSPRMTQWLKRYFRYVLR